MEIEQAFDLKRLFLGDVPLLFFLEIGFRTLVMYGYALLMLRLLGKRGQRQLSIFEFAIVIALGSAVGDPMLYPQVPLLHGMVTITVIVGLNKLLEVLVKNYERVETFVEGTPTLLVQNGYLSREQYGPRGIMAREELFAVLRNNKAAQLGQVKRAYMEQTGQISVFLYDEAEVRPGLPLIPPWDLSDFATYRAEEAIPEAGPFACWTCGFMVRYEDGEVFTLCPNCEHGKWTVATKVPLQAVKEERVVGQQGHF